MFVGLAFCGMAVSCQQDPGDLGKTQTNPQEEVLEGTAGVSLTLVPTSAIDLPYYYSINSEAFMVNLFSVTIPEALANANMSYEMEIAGTPTYADAVNIALKPNSEEGSDPFYLACAPASLQEVYDGVYSKFETSSQPLYVRVAVYAEFENKNTGAATKIRVGGANYNFLSGSSIYVTPKPIEGLMLGTPGADGKSTAESMRLQRNTGSSDVEYAGFVVINNPFTIASLPGDKELALGYETEGKLSTNSSDQIPVPADGPGLYFVTVKQTDDVAYSFTTTKISAVGCIGDFNSWGGDAALDPNQDGTIWSGDVDFTATGGWKFRMNGGWDVNLGGSESDLNPFNAPNLLIDTEGVYTVTLDLSKLPYTCTLTRK